MKRPALLAVAVITLLILVVLAFLTYDAVTARTALLKAETQTQKLQRQIGDGDIRSAQATLDDLQESTRSARSHSDGVLWTIGGGVPFVGGNFDAVRVVSQVLDSIASTALPRVIDSEVDADTFRPEDGRIDLTGMEELAPDVAEIARSISGGLEKLETIDTEGLAGPLQGPYGRLRSKLVDAEEAASAGAKAL